MATLTSIGYGIGKYLTDADQDAVGADLSTINNGLLQFKIADSKNYAFYTIVNGSVDAYTDETGIDTSTSTNETYDATNDLYSPTGGNTNMTLVSNAFTAAAQSDFSRFVFFEEDVDACTLNTDIKAYVSRDNGTTFTQVTLADKGNYASGKRDLSGSVDISGQPAGTAMKYKIETLNNKNLKIHGANLNW